MSQHNSRVRGVALAGLACASVAMISCDESDGPTGLDATGTVVGAAWIDVNGNGMLDAADLAAPDVVVELRTSAGSSPVASADAGENGIFQMDDVPVGHYDVTIDLASLGDTLDVLRIDSAEVVVRAADTTTVRVGLSYPALSLPEVRAAPPEQRIMLDAVALNAWSAFGDSTLHVRGGGAALRTIRVLPSTAAAGDSVRLIGTTALADGQPVLRDVAVLVLASARAAPAAISVRTAVAASADDGQLDAQLVKVHAAEVLETGTTTAGESRLTVDDGSGPLHVVLDPGIDFGAALPTPLVGALLDVGGLLVPAPTGEWSLHPRGPADIQVQ